VASPVPYSSVIQDAAYSFSQSAASKPHALADSCVNTFPEHMVIGDTLYSTFVEGEVRLTKVRSGMAGRAAPPGVRVLIGTLILEIAFQLMPKATTPSEQLSWQDRYWELHAGLLAFARGAVRT